MPEPIYLNKSIIDLLFFTKQVSEWTRFVKLKRSQKFSSLSLSELELLISMLKSPITIRLSYLNKALLITSFISLKNVSIFPVDRGLYILKQIHFFFKIVNSEQIHSLQLASYFFQPFADKALPNKLNKSTSMFISFSSCPYFISIELKLDIWETFIQFSFFHLITK